jgi:hypothetical protein
MVYSPTPAFRLETGFAVSEEWLSVESRALGLPGRLATLQCRVASLNRQARMWRIRACSILAKMEDSGQLTFCQAKS